MKKIITLTLILFFVTGCSYTGYLKQGFHTPGKPLVNKMDLTVGLVNTKELQNYRMQEYTGNQDLTIYINPAFNEELVKELKNIFTTIQILDSPIELNKFNAEVIPYLNYEYVEGTAWTAIYKYKITIRLTFIDVKSKAIIDNFQHTTELLITPPASATFMSILTGLSLFILSPITLPLALQFGGDNAKEIIEEGISRTFDILSYQIAYSEKIRYYTAK